MYYQSFPLRPNCVISSEGLALHNCLVRNDMLLLSQRVFECQDTNLNTFVLRLLSWCFQKIPQNLKKISHHFDTCTNKGQLISKHPFGVKKPTKLLFLIDFFLEARAEILEKISLVFWKTFWHQKDILKLTDLYQCQKTIGHISEFRGLFRKHQM